MKVGIIVYSRTNNTLKVAMELEKKIRLDGHDVQLLQVSARDDKQRKSKNIVLEQSPVVTPFDVVIFGSPVHASKLSPIMQVYLDQLPSLQGKTVAGFVTQAFPFAFMGGNQAITCLKALVHLKSASLTKGLIVHWFPSKKREKTIEITIEALRQIMR